MVSKSIIGATCACLVVVSFNSNSALIGRLAATPGGTDYQAYYDTDADLTWLADANAGAGSQFDNGSSTTDGLMQWWNANNWAASIDVNGVTGWRLPDTLQPDASCSIKNGNDSSGFNCTGSEMGNLFYNVLGGVAGESIITTHNSNYDLFNNVQSFNYWSSTVFGALTQNAWSFDYEFGSQPYSNKTSSYYAWAVQSGDVSPVPIPSAIWLFGSGLIGLIGLARRRANA